MTETYLCVGGPLDGQRVARDPCIGIEYFDINNARYFSTMLCTFEWVWSDEVTKRNTINKLIEGYKP